MLEWICRLVIDVYVNKELHVSNPEMTDTLIKNECTDAFPGERLHSFRDCVIGAEA